VGKERFEALEALGLSGIGMRRGAQEVIRENGDSSGGWKKSEVCYFEEFAEREFSGFVYSAGLNSRQDMFMSCLG